MVFYHRLSVLWLRVRRSWCGICEVDPRYYAISWAFLPVVCPTVWCHMSLLLALVHMETVRFIVFVDTNLLLSGLYPFPLWTLMWFIRMFCGDSPCYLVLLLADCTITYDVYSTPIWGTGALCMCDWDKWCCLFLLGYQLVKERWVVFSWIMTWSGEAMSITRYIVDKLMLSACAKLEHD